ncbi:MAG TPA: hypothetical protein VJ208_02625 [Candidatus Nanoarchaeia archaeon]|nr:hypothetical protein [Candidatus Nanoarchaeia archaeon]
MQKGKVRGSIPRGGVSEFELNLGLCRELVSRCRSSEYEAQFLVGAFQNLI